MNNNNKHIINSFAFFILAAFASHSSYSMSTPSSPISPWFTGPILAPSGRTIPNGHTNLEIYAFDFKSSGRYNNHGKYISRTPAYTTQYSAIFAHGLTNVVDMQFVLPYTINRFRGKKDDAIGDTKVLLGYQVMTQPDGTWWPNIRATIQETIPTGKYDQLSSTLLTTDDHGKGSYLTTFNLNFQTLFHPVIDHYLRTRLSFSFTIPSDVQVNGVSHFGGATDTSGKVNPGNAGSVDVAAELTLNQHWVAVMEGLLNLGAPLTFTGNPGMDAFGMPIAFQAGANNLLSIAPALEYNFNSNYGIIAGAWWTLRGKNISQFVTPVIALNAFW